MFKKLYEKMKNYNTGDFDSIPEENVSMGMKSAARASLQIRFAKKYQGKHEVRNNVMLTSLLGFDPAKTPWCAGFVNAIEKRCKRKGTGSLAARSFLKYGTAVKKPQIGDIVVFKRGKLPWQGHVGYFIREDEKGILVLGGNQSNKVCYKYYPVRALLGYRRP